MTISILTRTLVTATTILTLAVASGCAATPVTPPTEPAHATQPAEQPSDQPSSSPTPNAASSETPEQAFRSWLAASRVPDADTACGYLNDALIERMLSELRTSGMNIGTCEEMTALTAQAYKAAGNSQDVDIQTRSETASEAELFVAYAGGTACGRVVMERIGTTWIMTENSQREC